MKLKISVLASVLALIVSAPVNAGFLTGGKLLPLCESGSASEMRACEMYLIGITDAQDGFNRLGGLNTEYFCLAKGVSLPQIREIFIKYANGNTKYLKLPASRSVIGAFAQAFPCQ